MTLVSTPHSLWPHDKNASVNHNPSLHLGDIETRRANYTLKICCNIMIFGDLLHLMPVAQMGFVPL